MICRIYTALTLFIMMLFIGWLPTAAQMETCPPTVETLNTLATTCDGLQRGQQCNADGITHLSGRSITSDQETAQVIKLQGTLPTVSTEQNIVMVLAGDITLQNTVSDAQHFAPPEPITVQSTARVNLRQQPTTQSAVLGGVEVNTNLFADARSDDKAWLRVAYLNSSAWVSRDYVQINGSVDSLPVFNDGYNDYQSLQLSAGCGMMLVQTPRVTEIQLILNGEPITINNSVLFDFIDDQTLRVSALDGGVRFENGVSIPRGFSTNIMLDADGIVSGDWRRVRPMNTGQMDAYEPFTALPVGLVNEPVTLPIGKYIRPGTGIVTSEILQRSCNC